MDFASWLLASRFLGLGAIVETKWLITLTLFWLSLSLRAIWRTWLIISSCREVREALPLVLDLDLVIILDLRWSNLITLVLHTFLSSLFHAYGLIILHLQSFILRIQIIMIPLSHIVNTRYSSLASLLVFNLFYFHHVIIIQLKALRLLLISVDQVPFTKLIQKISVATGTTLFESYNQRFFLLVFVNWIAAVELFKLLNFFILHFEYFLHFLLRARWAFVAATDVLVFGSWGFVNLNVV